MMLGRVLLGFTLALFLAGGCVLILVSTSSVTIPPASDHQVMPQRQFGFPPAAATAEQLLPDGTSHHHAKPTHCPPSASCIGSALAAGRR